MKVIGKSLALVFFISISSLHLIHAQSIPNSKLSYSSQLQTIRFSWKGDSMQGRWNEHAAMLIPVTLKNCPKKFYMQFDLGAPSSLFYKNKIEAIRKKYPACISFADTVSTISDFSFTIDRTTIVAHQIMIRQFDSSAVNWSKDAIEIIGTIGADLIDNKTITINYPSRLIQLSDSVPPRYQNASFSDCIFARRALLIPAIIQSKKTLLYFDTGSSAFELLTNKETVQSMATNNAIPVKYPVDSWGKQLWATTISTSDSIEIASKKIPINKATYIEGMEEGRVAQMMKMGIGGMTGNALFLQHILIIDTRNKKLAIVKP